jgi:hypothetical protein
MVVLAGWEGGRRAGQPAQAGSVELAGGFNHPVLVNDARWSCDCDSKTPNLKAADISI